MLSGKLDAWSSCEFKKFLPVKLSVFIFESQKAGWLLPAVGYFWMAEIEVFNFLPLGTFQL